MGKGKKAMLEITKPEFGISRCPKIKHVFRHAASSIHMSAWLPVCRKKFNRFLIR